MKQEDKDLLLKDLCGRLLYGVKMNHIADDKHQPNILIGIAKDMITLQSLCGYSTADIEDYKPYLFPLSSMTDEQKKYITDRWGINEDFDFEIDPDWGEYFVDLGDVVDYVNWLIANHFDYKGLIQMGLANDATGLNIY